MNALVLEAPAAIDKAPLKRTELPVPSPGATQVLVAVSTCGLCHTDLHTIEGDLDLPRTPIVPGHQIVGRVQETGRQVTTLEEGDRVGIGWLYDTCGSCDYCTNGQENLCPDARFTGLHENGGYAQYTVVEENFTYRLPETFADAEAAPLLCAGIIGFRSLRRSNIEPGQRLGLYGFGSSAHLAIQVAIHWDCEVYVFSRTPAHRELAEELGAVWTGSAKEMPPEQLHAGVTFAPAGWIVAEALKHLRAGGTLAINAIHMSPIPELPYERIYHERTVQSVKNFTRDDARTFLDLTADIPIETTVQTFPLADANAALKALKNSEIDGAAALSIPQP